MGGIDRQRPFINTVKNAKSAAWLCGAFWRANLRFAACLLLCATALCACRTAEPSAPEAFEPENAVSDAPIFDYSDVETVFAGYTTLASYAEPIQPQLYYWSTYGITGDVYVEMLGGSETVIVRILNEDAASIPLFKQEPQGETPVMPDEILALPCLPAGAVWIGEDTLLEPPRGVMMGDSIEELINSFRADGTGDGELYTITALNPDADDSWRADDQYWLGAYLQIDADDYYDYYVVYSWADVQAPEERREYWHLYYTIIDETIDSITLSYNADLPYGYAPEENDGSDEDYTGDENDDGDDYMELPEPEDAQEQENDDR